jgi:hypothetical protein
MCPDCMPERVWSPRPFSLPLHALTLGMTLSHQSLRRGTSAETVANTPRLDILSREFRETCVTREQVEHVARTFYDAEEHRGDWHDAPAWLRERFRDRARTALATLNRQIAECRSAAKPAA